MKKQALKIAKHALSLVLAFAVLAMSLFTGTALTVSAASDTLYWDGITYTQPTDEDGDGVYIIDTAAKLAYLACKTQSKKYETYGKTFKVADGIKSIVLQPESLSAIKDKTSAAEVKAFFDENATSAKWWNVIGYRGEYPFQGTFDGNGATIYGIYANWASYTTWQKDLYAGLFGLVDQGAVIKNVAVKNSYLTTYSGFMGAIFANTAMDDANWNATANMGTGDVVVENCVAANNYMNAPTENYYLAKKYGVLVGASGYDYLKMNNCMAYGNDAKTDLVTPDSQTFDIPFIGCLSGAKVDGLGANSVKNVIALGATPYNRYDFSWGAYVNHKGDGTNTSCFENVYTDQPIGNFTMYSGSSAYTIFENSEIYGLVSVTAEGITGADAVDAMPELDWVNAWFAVRDGMPELRAFHTTFTATDNGDGTHTETCSDCGLVGVAMAHTDTDEDYICDVCGAELPRPDTSVIYWDGTQATGFASGSGTKDDPYIIANAEQMAYAALSTTLDSKGKYFKVIDNAVFNMNGMAGITLDSTAEQVQSATKNDSYKWNSESSTFAGNFDGNGAVIYNIYANDLYAGLFPNINTNNTDKSVTISNITVKASCFIAYHNAGGIVGLASASTTSQKLNFSQCAVVNCYITDNNSKNPACNRTSGTIAGSVAHNGTTVENCLAKGNLLVSTDIKGGFIGNTSAYSPDVCVKSSISIGTLPYPTLMAGSTKTLESHATAVGGYSDVYTDCASASAYRGVKTLTIAQMTGEDAVSNMNLDFSNVWFANTGTPELRAFHTSFTATDNGDGTHTETCSDCGLVGVAMAHTDTDEDYICDVCGAELPRHDTSVIYWDGSTYTQPTDEDGDGVYIIDTAAKLAYIACKTQSNRYETYGKTYKVADGIKAIVLQPESLSAIKDKTTAAEVKAFFDENATSAKWWNVIGYRGAYPFQGTFDGNGATIYGIYANWASYADWHSDLYAGLFGLVDQGAVIKNVAVKNSYLTTKNGFMGAIFANTAMDDAGWNATANMGTGDVVVENCVAANNYMNAPTENYNNQKKYGVLVGASGYDYLKMNNCMAYGNDAKTDIVTPDSEVFDIPFIGALNGDKVGGKGVNSVTNVISLGATPYNRYAFSWGAYVTHEGDGTNTSCFKNVYTDQPIGYFTMYNNTTAAYSIFENSEIYGLVSVTAEGITGADAVDAMPELDWVNTWFAVRDGMPELRAFHTTFTATDNGDGTHSESCDDCGLGIATAHYWSNADGVCATCGAVCMHGFDISDEGALVFEKTIPGDCTTVAQGVMMCSICGIRDTEVISDPSGMYDHNFTDVSAKEPTCTKKGNIAYKKCIDCGKMFDDDGNELTVYDVIIYAPGHSLVYIDAVDPTCADSGNKAYNICEVCCKIFDNDGNELTLEDVTIPATGIHDWSNENGYCAECGKACGHGSIVFEKTIEGDCETPAKGVYMCTICGRRDTTVIDDPYSVISGHDFEGDACVKCGKSVSECIASEHDYSSDCDQTWTIKKDGATQIRITFSNDTYTESDYDYIYIYDGSDNLIGKYTGSELAGKTIKVASDTVKIRLTSDSFVNGYGFAVTNVSCCIGHDWSNKDGICAECGAECEHDWADGECSICGKKQYAPGDVNGDGKVNNKDLVLLGRFIHVWDVEFTGDDGDVNGDGKVNNKDYGLLMQFVNGWDVILI